MSTSLVTGVSGFIASHLARALAGRGDAVIGAGRSPGAFTEGTFARLDVRDFDATLALLSREKPDAVYHLGALSVLQQATGDEGARAMLETNVAGTWNVLEACRRVGVPVVVVASSDKQYGALAAPPYDDDDTTGFLNGGVYELSKAHQDQTARLYAGVYDAPSVRVARLVNIYGPNDRQFTRIVPGNIRRAFLGEPGRVTAGPAGEALREYVFVDDAVDALLALAGDALARGNAPLRRADGRLARVGFNIGAEAERYAAAGVIAAIRRVMHDDFGIVSPEPQVQPGTPGLFEPGSQFARSDKLRGLFPAYAPRSLDDGLRATIPWYLDHLRT